MQKNVAEQHSNIVVKNGMLNFKDNEQFSKIVTIVGKMNIEERKQWEQEIGFISQQSIFEQIIATEIKLDAPYENLSEEEINQIKVMPPLHSDLYSKYLNSGIIKEINKDTDDEYYDLSIFNPCLAHLVNLEGFYAIGDTIYQITENFEKIITDGDFSKIDKLKQTKITNEEENIIVIPLNNTKRSTTFLNKTSNWVNSGGGKKGEKRINIRLYFHSYLYHINTDQFRIYHNVFVKCQERNWRRQWRYKGTEIWVNGSWQFRTGLSNIYNKSFYRHENWAADYKSSVSPFTGYSSPWETSWLYNGVHNNVPKLLQASWSAERYGGASGLTATVSY